MKRLVCSIFVIPLLLYATTGFLQLIKRTYAIKNMQTGLLLRIKDANKSNGTPLVAYTPEDWKCMTWNFIHMDGQTYQLENLLTGKTIQPANETPGAGDALIQQPVDKIKIQQYEFIPVEKNTFLVKLKGTDLYITSPGEKGIINAPIILSKKDGSRGCSNGLYTNSILKYKIV